MHVNIPPTPSVCHNEDQSNNIFWWHNAMNVNIPPPPLYATTKINVTTSFGDTMPWTLTSPPPPSACHNEDQRNNIFCWRNIQGTLTSPPPHPFRMLMSIRERDLRFLHAPGNLKPLPIYIHTHTYSIYIYLHSIYIYSIYICTVNI